jgi:hypothetical protein
MLTHVHKVIHKVVGIFARVFERKRKVETPSPSCRSAGFGKETKVKHVTGSDRMLASGAPMRPVSSGRGAREGAKRANAGRGTPTCSVHFCMAADAGDQM